MVTVEEAKQILTRAVDPLNDVIAVKTIHALGYTLAEDSYAPVSLPPFDQSNVDGYAVRLSSTGNHNWKVVGEVKAGDGTTIELNAGEAVRIYTGAMVPKGTDIVIMQERIMRDGNEIHYSEESPLTAGEHVRCKGAQIKAGELALSAGVYCTPSVISFISSLGIGTIKVFRKPIIALIITGSELQSAGEALTEGKVYESNSSALNAAFAACGIAISKTVFVKDNKADLDRAYIGIMNTVDVVIFSGGISVGDYDFVNEVVQTNDTVPLFYKVAQKPGKPLYFGKNKNTFVFGLPGNPASALTCFYEYVLPVLRKLQGRHSIFLTALRLPVSKPIVKKKGLANFLKAHINSSGVEPLTGQESFIMKSFAVSNAFIYLPKEKENVAAGELVEVHVLPEF